MIFPHLWKQKYSHFFSNKKKRVSIAFKWDEKKDRKNGVIFVGK